jgi:hypothetical protein
MFGPGRWHLHCGSVQGQAPKVWLHAASPHGQGWVPVPAPDCGEGVGFGIGVGIGAGAGVIPPFGRTWGQNPFGQFAGAAQVAGW